MDKENELVYRFLVYGSIIGLVFLIIINIVFCLNSYYVKNNGYREYMLKLHYLDGKNEIRKLTVESRDFPAIQSGIGGYHIQVGHDRIWGVIRFDIISCRYINSDSSSDKEILCHLLMIIVTAAGLGMIIYFNKNALQGANDKREVEQI